MSWVIVRTCEVDGWNDPGNTPYKEVQDAVGPFDTYDEATEYDRAHPTSVYEMTDVVEMWSVLKEPNG